MKDERTFEERYKVTEEQFMLVERRMKEFELYLIEEGLKSDQGKCECVCTLRSCYIKTN